MNPELEYQIRDWVAHSEGWMVPERAIEMAQLILKHRPKICVELGCFGGRSLVSQAMALRETGRGKIYGIDPWRKESTLEGENKENQDWWASLNLEQIHQYCMSAIWKYKLEDFAVVIRSESQCCKDLFFHIDHLFIDGNHSEVASCRDVTNYLPSVRRGGIVVFDDANWPSTQKALAMLDNKCDLLKDGQEYRIYQKR